MSTAEAHADVAHWITPWTPEQHEAALGDTSMAELVIVDHDRLVDHVILQDVGHATTGIQLRRLVVSERGRGVGAAALPLVLDHCFGPLGTHRVWLDVLPENERALTLYRRVGFREEGRLRDAYRRPDGSLWSLVLMAVLATEWRSGR